MPSADWDELRKSDYTRATTIAFKDNNAIRLIPTVLERRPSDPNPIGTQNQPNVTTRSVAVTRKRNLSGPHGHPSSHILLNIDDSESSLSEVPDNVPGASTHDDTPRHTRRITILR
ncbi:hypothetical protein N7534_010346 [Penicillium rubens]|nr:hypothetical protein N7534_010346 [Penicillium rubens]